MPLNSAGVHEYDEFEDAAPFSTLLNRLSDSLTDLLTADIISVAFGGNTQSGGLTLARIGNMVAASCSFQIGSAETNTPIGTVPVSHRPLSGFTGYVNLAPNNGTNPGSAWLQIAPSTGTVTFFMYPVGGTPGATGYLRGAGVWPGAI